MTRLNPDLFPDDAVVDDNSSTHLRKSWSAKKLYNLFGAFLEEHALSEADIVPPTLGVVTEISSSEPFLTVELLPSGGVLAIDDTKIRLRNSINEVVELDSAPFVIDGEDLETPDPGKVFLRIPLPDSIAPNTSYTLELDEGALFNGNLHNVADSRVLTSSIISFVKPTFGSPVAVPADANHNLLNRIDIPVTSNHSGRDLHFDDSKVSITGGAFNLVSATWNQALLRVELNIQAGSMEPSTNYTISFAEGSLIDDDIYNISTSEWGNAAVDKFLLTASEVKPVFAGGINTDSLDTNPQNITKIYFNLSNLAYLNLTRNSSIFISARVGSFVENMDFTVNAVEKRVEIDLVQALSQNAGLLGNFITADNKLVEDTSYEFTVPVGAVEDGLEVSDEFIISFTTDNEADILLGNLQSDTGTRAFGMTSMYVYLLGGPTFNNPPYTDFSGVTINGGTTLINGGTLAITYNAAQQRIEIPVQNINAGGAYEVIIPADSIKDGSSGHTEFTAILNTDIEVAPVVLSSSISGIDVNYKTNTQVELTVDDSLAYSGSLEFDPTKIQVAQDGTPLVLNSDFSVAYDDVTKKILISALSLKYSASYNITVLLDALKDGFTGNSSTYSYPFTTADRYSYEPTFGDMTPADGTLDLDYMDFNDNGSNIFIEINTASMHDIAYSKVPVTLSNVLSIETGNITLTESSNPVGFTAVIEGTALKITLDTPAVEGQSYSLTLGADSVLDVSTGNLVYGPLTFSTVADIQPSFTSLTNPVGATAAESEFTGANRIKIGITNEIYNNLTLTGTAPEYGIVVSGCDLVSVALNGLELELEVNNVVLGALEITFPAGILTDGLYSNIDTPTFSFTVVDASQPVFALDLNSDSGNNKSMEVSQFLLDITSTPHSNLQLDAGFDIRLRRYIDGSTFHEGTLSATGVTLNTVSTPPRLEVVFSDPTNFSSFTGGATYADIIDTTNDNKLFENKSYKLWVAAGSVTDGALNNDEYLSNDFITDDEIPPALDVVITTNGDETAASLITEFIVSVTGGPFVNALALDGALASSIEVRNVTDTTLITKSGAVTLTNDGSYKIHIPVTDSGSAGGMVPGKNYEVFIPAGFVKDGSQGNVAFTSNLFAVADEISPTISLMTPSGLGIDYHFATTDVIELSITSEAYSNLQAFPNLLVFEKSVKDAGSFTEIVAGITKSFNGTDKLLITLTDGVLDPTYDYRVTAPAGTLKDGLTDSIEFIGTFQTVDRLEIAPAFDFASAVPANGATSVNPDGLSHIDIPISTTHEAPLTLDASILTLVHVNDGTSDAAITSVTLESGDTILRITLTNALDNSLTYTVGIDASSVLDGTTGNVEVTVASGTYSFTTSDAFLDRRTFMAYSSATVYGNQNDANAVIYQTGTRTPLAIDLTAYPDYQPIADNFFLADDFTSKEPRKFHIIKLKANGDTSGATLDPVVVSSTSDAGAAAWGSGISAVNTGSNYFDFFNGPSTAYLYDLIIFETPQTEAEVQAWADAQDWSSYISL